MNIKIIIILIIILITAIILSPLNPYWITDTKMEYFDAVVDVNQNINPNTNPNINPNVNPNINPNINPNANISINPIKLVSNPTNQPVTIIDTNPINNIAHPVIDAQNKEIMNLDNYNMNLTQNINKCVMDAQYYHDISKTLQKKLDRVYKELYELRQSYNRAQEQLVYCKKYVSRDSNIVDWMSDRYFTHQRGNFI